MAGLRRFVGFWVAVIAVAVFLVVAVEYWRASRTDTDRSRPVSNEIRGSILQANAFSGAAAGTRIAANDGGMGASADLVAVAGALEQANERVRLLGEERDALLLERDQLTRTRGDLSRRLDDASREIAALEEKVAGLDDRVVRGGDETDRLELSLDALETRLDTVTAERDSLRRQLAETSQRLAELQAVTTDVEPAAGNANANAGNAANRNAENPQAANLRRPQAGATQPAASLPPLTIVRPAPDATVNDGISAYEAGDYARARDIWRELAEAGSPRAQFHLGSLLYEGRVGQPDLVQAYRWLSRSVERGFGPALSMRDRVRSSMSREQLGEAEGPLG